MSTFNLYGYFVNDYILLVDPIITGIGWVSELIEIAGGIDCFSNNAKHHDAKQRIITNPHDVVAQQPDIIIGSWCGKRFHPYKVAEREGWADVPAVINNQVFEIKSPLILQPGPAAVTDGLDQISTIIETWRKQTI